MSPRGTVRPPSPSAAALRDRLSVAIGAAVRDERQRRGWSLTELASRARLSVGTVSGVEAGRVTSLDTCARLASALGQELHVAFDSRRRGRARPATDLVHAAMGEVEAHWLQKQGFEVSIDHPYQHYQFAGRADVLAWSRDPPALLHIENRTRFPDLQAAAGSYNAKRRYLGRSLARELGLPRFGSETHVMAGLWSSEVIHSVRIRPASFKALCPNGTESFEAWRRGVARPPGSTSAFILLDPFATGRQAKIASLERVLSGLRPRVRGYAEAARLVEGRRR